MVGILTETRAIMKYFKFITMESCSHSVEEKRRKLLSLISATKPDHKDAILDYLQNGCVISHRWGVMHDWVQAETPRIGPGPNTFTDGVWAWTEEIIYYVKVYNLQLPMELLDRMEALHWKVPVVNSFTLRKRSLARKRMLWKTWRPNKGGIT
jgi:hypothetical protein